jgi:aspartate racemase
MIGVVGGVGPYAGLDLVKKIFDNSLAECDQDYPAVIMISQSAKIADRTAYLLGEISQNPGEGLAEVVLALERAGASVVGIPCNTAHAPAIFGHMRELLQRQQSKVRILHMIEETVNYITRSFPKVRRIGVLATTGTQKTRIYPEFLEKQGLQTIVPDDEIQQKVHQAIYDPEYGIKIHPVTDRARETVHQALAWLFEQGAEAAILGCTELPLAVPEKEIAGHPVVDPTWILARALLREVFPEKLKPET